MLSFVEMKLSGKWLLGADSCSLWPIPSISLFLFPFPHFHSISHLAIDWRSAFKGASTMVPYALQQRTHTMDDAFYIWLFDGNTCAWMRALQFTFSTQQQLNNSHWLHIGRIVVARRAWNVCCTLDFFIQVLNIGQRFVRTLLTVEVDCGI